MNVVTLTSGIRDKATDLYGNDRDMTGNAYLLIDIHGNKLIKVANRQELTSGSFFVFNPLSAE
ncbi:hypothetical protein MHH49_05690 [Paenibacillus sp. FSL F4-0122]|uniref:hypothetical protein n=1 Tax=Paenibacillus sp. FSL F4-0122 TaxID=2921371 RepID=UPI0030F9AC7A